MPDFAIKPNVGVKIPAYLDAELAKSFAQGERSIRPVVFSHGLSLGKEFY